MRVNGVLPPAWLSIQLAHGGAVLVRTRTEGLKMSWQGGDEDDMVRQRPADIAQSQAVWHRSWTSMKAKTIATSDGWTWMHTYVKHQI
jgi:hypothetical protein